MPANTARNYLKGDYERDDFDWYVEPEWCVDALFDNVQFDNEWIWDPCCGQGTILKSAEKNGFRFLIGSDIVDRGLDKFTFEICDALKFGTPLAVSPAMTLNIVTNPPYKLAENIIRENITLIDQKMAVLLPIKFLASQKRYALFTEYPPAEILMLSKRPSMPPGGKIEEMGDRAFKGGTIDYCWIVWHRPHDRETRIRWANPNPAPPEHKE